MMPDMVWYPHLAQQLNIILKLSGLPPCDTRPEWSTTIVKFVQNLLIRCDIDVYCMFMLGYKARHRYSVKREARTFFIDAVIASNTTERRAIIWKLGRLMLSQTQQHSISRLNSSDRERARRRLQLDPLEACHVLLSLLDTMNTQGLSIATLGNFREIRDFFKVVDEGLRMIADLQDYDTHREIAKHCLELINRLDLSAPPDSDNNGLNEEAFWTWAEEFPERKSRFPETFIDALRRFLPFGDDTSFSHRVRRYLYFEQLESTSQGDLLGPPSASTVS
ncbi:hypothetical protein BDY19DRAFT_938577 [Irpex rosettiformis]|uniref:Uncharacterized protein n=1 Tax=Irpex rosettiformis TaxID=378272 RepID=A0ACB8U6Z6_9APHY|nr:hypothetical protein BDY19DRAFT_938577 [Irpex rosettiformis]